MSVDQQRIPLLERLARLLHAIQADDEAEVQAVIRLSRSRRLFAPLAFTVGAFAMLFDGLRLLLANWRLMIIEILPAVWIWLAMLDLKVHVLHGRTFHDFKGVTLIPINLAIVAITAGSFFLNAVFGFAVSGPPPPKVRPAWDAARLHLTPILGSGAIVGLLLGFSTTVAPRWAHPWFSLSLGAVIGVMTICYVAVPSRIIGVKPTYSKRDKLTASVLGGLLSTAVCTPPYLIGRLGIVMLGSRVLLIPGIFVLVFGFTLQAGATGAVRAIKMSVSLTGHRAPGADPPEETVV